MDQQTSRQRAVLHRPGTVTDELDVIGIWVTAAGRAPNTG